MELPMQSTVSIPVILFALGLSTSVVYAAPVAIPNGHTNFIVKVQDENKDIEKEQNKLPSSPNSSESAAPAAPAAPSGSAADDEIKKIEKEQNKQP
jgi:hypothetical protein